MNVPWPVITLLLISGIPVYEFGDVGRDFDLSGDLDYQYELLGDKRRSLIDSNVYFEELSLAGEGNSTPSASHNVSSKFKKHGLFDEDEENWVEPDGYAFIEDENFNLEAIRNYSRQGLGYTKLNFTAQDAQDILVLHNTYRGNMTKPIPFMSNVNFLQWNAVLALEAETLASECPDVDSVMYNVTARKSGSNGTTESGSNATKNGSNGTMNDTTSKNITVKLHSLNLYDGSSRLTSRPLWLWYEGYMNYNFKERRCPPHQGCDSYETMTYYYLTSVGCARSMCWPLDERLRVVCAYGPRVDLRVDMFRYGNPCDHCERGYGAKCIQNLCATDDICKDGKNKCSCNLKCLNCGKMNKTTCSCDCPPGWDYPNCGVQCRNMLPNVCNMEIQKSCSENPVTSQRDCRSLCGTCQPRVTNPNTTKTGAHLCCNGSVCEDGQHLDERTCKCVETCPSKKCMFNSKIVSVGEPKIPTDLIPKENFIPAVLPSDLLMAFTCFCSFILLFK